MKKCPGEDGAQREGQKRRQNADGFNLAKESGGKAKVRRDSFSDFDGLVQQRIEMTLRCAPVISILWGLGIVIRSWIPVQPINNSQNQVVNRFRRAA